MKQISGVALKNSPHLTYITYTTQEPRPTAHFSLHMRAHTHKQTGSEASVDRLMKQISGFMSEISDDFKIVVIDAIRALCLKFPSKQHLMLTFLSGVLRDEVCVGGVCLCGWAWVFAVLSPVRWGRPRSGSCRPISWSVETVVPMVSVPVSASVAIQTIPAHIRPEAAFSHRMQCLRRQSMRAIIVSAVPPNGPTAQALAAPI